MNNIERLYIETIRAKLACGERIPSVDILELLEWIERLDRQLKEPA